MKIYKVFDNSIIEDVIIVFFFGKNILLKGLIGSGKIVLVEIFFFLF